MNNENLYGSVGYEYLIKDNNNRKYKILMLADQHDELPSCRNSITMAELFKNKLKLGTSNILLEEVPRVGDNNLIELWAESAHTQELKNLYLENNLITGVDIRPFLIPFSWEIFEDINKSTNEYNISIIDYLKEIDKFFSLKHEFIMSNLPNYNGHILKNTLLGNHFLLIKKRFDNYLKNLNNRKLLFKQVRYLYLNHQYELNKINKILDDIMEWYTCAHIELSKNKPIIIHAGLAHTEKLNEWLKLHYGYKTKHKEGINTIRDARISQRNGCVGLSLINTQFGGNKIYHRYLK